MYKFAIVFLFFIFSLKLHAQENTVRSVKFAKLEKILHAETDTLYVVNFWATWCVPCVKELPYFEAAKAQFADNKVRILLVNLDFKKELQSRVVPFVHKKKLKNEVWFLDESDPNSYIDKVSPHWSGAIPFTLFYNARLGSKAAFEKSLSQQQLTDEINKELNRIK